MTDVTALEVKLKELEDRVKKLEDDSELMQQLYDKARHLVEKYHRSSAIFLQKKLLIDYPRARNLVDRLRQHGVIDTKDQL